MRLIDADVAKEMLKRHADEFSDVLSRKEKTVLIGGGTSCIDKCPTVDALVLPCKIGDDVYIIPSKAAFDWSVLTGHTENIKVYHQYVVCVTFTERGWHIVTNAEKYYGTGKVSVDSSYKETWFLTREEAEAALAKMKGGTSDA